MAATTDRRGADKLNDPWQPHRGAVDQQRGCVVEQALALQDKPDPLREGLLGVHSRYACTLALSPIRDTLSEGFSQFVTSMAAPVASGWSVCRVGLAPTEKRRLVTAHTQFGHSGLRTAPAMADRVWFTPVAASPIARGAASPGVLRLAFERLLHS